MIITKIDKKYFLKILNFLLMLVKRLAVIKLDIIKAVNINKTTPRQKSIRALEIFRVQKLILNATS